MNRDRDRSRARQQAGKAAAINNGCTFFKYFTPRRLLAANGKCKLRTKEENDPLIDCRFFE